MQKVLVRIERPCTCWVEREIPDEVIYIDRDDDPHIDYESALFREIEDDLKKEKYPGEFNFQPKDDDFHLNNIMDITDLKGMISLY